MISINEKAQIFYEISMSISTDLDLTKMLQNCFITILRRFNCLGGGVLFLKNDDKGNFFFEKVFSIPRNTEHFPSSKSVFNRFPNRFDDQFLFTFSKHLPMTGTSSDGVFYYILLLPGLGVLVLLKKGKKLMPSLINSLSPILKKIANACNTCLRNEELERTRNKLVDMNKELSIKSEEINNSKKVLLSIMEDMQKTQSELTYSNTRLDIILHSIGDGVLVVNFEQKCMIINKKAEILLEIDSDYGKNKHLSELLMNCKDNGASLLKNLDKDSFDKVELEINAKVPRFLSVTGNQFLDVDYKKAGMVFIIRDITREREIDTMKTEFVSSVSHELRTPLASIMGFSSTILNDDEMENEIKSEFIEIIHKESLRLARLIEDLLSISRIESGKITYKFEELFIESILEEVIKEYIIIAKEKGLELNCNVKSKALPILANKDAIKQVIVNIVSNAIKFTNVGNVSIIVDEFENKLRIIIKDTGLGIPKRDIKNIFEKFYRVYRPGTHIKGTGLGLSIVKQIVESHNGTISVESENEKGTAFILNFPIYNEKEASNGN